MIVKQLVVSLLNSTSRRFLDRNKVFVIAVVGSVGKTSTANAIRATLAEAYAVQLPKTTYNTDKSIHLQIFGEKFATGPLGWVWLFLKMVAKSFGKTSYKYIVLELGTDRPGDLAKFSWLKPQICLVTSVAEEHMENFKNIDDVAEEELSVTKYSDTVFVNSNCVGKKYLDLIPNTKLILTGVGQEINCEIVDMNFQGSTLKFHLGRGRTIMCTGVKVFGAHAFDGLTAAVAVANHLSVDDEGIASGLKKIEPTVGRMQLLGGKKDSLIIDDSYNSSPIAVKAALVALYSVKAPKRIALLGQMNEFGAESETQHRTVGKLCDPKQLDLLVTLGNDANNYLADEAEKRGCKVIRTKSPYEAGRIVEENLSSKSVILVKGSQNGVFSEEAIKTLLSDPKDEAKLVRQSQHWMRKKEAQFS